MTNAPDTRKTHVVRILGTNRNGDRLDHIWADLERMDVIKGAMQIPPDFQQQDWQRKLRWHDDPDGEDEYFENGPPSRLFDIVKVCDPSTQDVDDPDEWIPIPVIRGMRSKGGGSEGMGQGFMDRFVNGADEDNIARIVLARKIAHYDTNIDDRAQAAFDADPSRTHFVVPGDAYGRVDGSKDDEQFVDHEIITYFKPRTNNLQVMGLGRQTKLRNQYLIDESEAPDGTEIGEGGINPPYRLDPFQNIVNVNFGVKVIVIIARGESGLTTAAIIQDNAEFLRDFKVEILSAGGQRIDCTAYKVNADKGEFLRTRFVDTAIVFAIDGDVDRSLDRAIEGMPGLLSAVREIMNSGSPLLVPAKIDPPGMLWLVTFFGLDDQLVTWKMRNGAHRNPGTNDPPNRMVQCYPLAVPYLVLGASCSGYCLLTYRLDRTGTGPSYGVNWSSPQLDPPRMPNRTTLMDPAWGQVIQSLFPAYGIPFVDPPPLVSVDRPSIGT